MNSYITKGVCSTRIDFEVEDGVLKNVNYCNGCPGNLIGISKLVEGMEIDMVIKKLKGITCGKKITSCPDQLSKALETWKKDNIKK